VQKVHWPLDDPAKASGTEDEIMAKFRTTRDEVRVRVKTLLDDIQRSGVAEVRV
jgi:arsenate reductase